MSILEAYFWNIPFWGVGRKTPMWNSLFRGHRVFVSVICNAGWSCALCASYSQWMVGPFAMIISQEPCVFE